MSSITGASATILLAVGTIFPVPVQLQGFAVDDVYTVDDIEPNETLMGVDGELSGGRVNVPIPWTVALQADSASNLFFDQWNAQEQATQQSYIATGIVNLFALGTKWVMTRGFLTRFKPMPDAKKLLQPRHYRITWQNVSPAPT